MCYLISCYYVHKGAFNYLLLTVECALIECFYICCKMRSAQTPFGIWAIMKKFIYVCNVKHYMFSRLVWLKYTI